MELTWIWVLIPITAILAKTIRQWLVLQTTQRRLGVSTQGLEREVAELQRKNEALLDRVQNLEAIVVSQTWDAVSDRTLPPAARDLRVASAARRELGAPDAAAANQQRAEQLAQRLQG